MVSVMCGVGEWYVVSVVSVACGQCGMWSVRCGECCVW